MISDIRFMRFCWGDQFGREAIDILAENIKRFKEFMNRVDNIQKEYEQNFDSKQD